MEQTEGISKYFFIDINTYQVKNYANYELAGFSEEAKRQYRDEH